MKNLLLLHGALGSKEQFELLTDYLKNDISVYTFSFSGHGRNFSYQDHFSIELFSREVLTFLSDNNLSSVHIFGYSMGGYVAFYLGRHYPLKVKGIFTLATKFNWTKETAEKEAALLNTELMEQKVPAFAQSLAYRHGDEAWKRVVQFTAEMMLTMGEQNPLTDADFEAIKIPVLLGLGDSDKMVSREETEKIHKLIPGSKMMLFKDMTHPLEKVNFIQLGDQIKDFIL